MPHAKVARAFEMFRKLGMRHLCVIDSDGCVVGMITRKDLMTYKITGKIMSPRTEALIRRFFYSWQLQRLKKKSAIS
eukprot:SAG31_NODE_44399_length_263_cov_0.615854_1_plen_76_part_10